MGVVHVYSPNYGYSGKLHPCPVCGYEYDRGEHYLQRPCPVCGAAELEVESLPELVHGAVSTFVHRYGIPRREIAQVIGISPHTLKSWEYRKCTYEQFERFSEAIRLIAAERKLYDVARREEAEHENGGA